MGLLDTGWKEDAPDDDDADAEQLGRWSGGGGRYDGDERDEPHDVGGGGDGESGSPGGAGGVEAEEGGEGFPSPKGRSRRGSKAGEEEMGFQRERRPSQLGAVAETASVNNATDNAGSITRLGAAACAVSGALAVRRNSIQSKFAAAAAAAAAREPGGQGGAGAAWGSERSATTASAESPRGGGGGGGRRRSSAASAQQLPTYKALQDEGVSEWTSPGSRFRVRLELCLACLLLYNLLTLPLRLAVLPGVANDSTGAGELLGWLAADVLIDAVYAADMLLYWKRFTASGADGELITDRRKLRRLWLRGGGRLDLLASLPLDYCVLASMPSDAQLAMLPRGLRLLRLSRVPRHLGVVRLLMARSNQQLSGALLRIIVMFASTAARSKSPSWRCHSWPPRASQTALHLKAWGCPPHSGGAAEHLRSHRVAVAVEPEAAQVASLTASGHAGTVLVVYSVTMAWLAVGVDAEGTGWFREFVPDNGAPDGGGAMAVAAVNLTAEAYQRALYFTLVTMTTVGYGDIVPHSYFETVVALMVVMMGGLSVR